MKKNNLYFQYSNDSKFYKEHKNKDSGKYTKVKNDRKSLLDNVNKYDFLKNEIDKLNKQLKNIKINLENYKKSNNNNLKRT